MSSAAGPGPAAGESASVQPASSSAPPASPPPSKVRREVVICPWCRAPWSGMRTLRHGEHRERRRRRGRARPRRGARRDQAGAGRPRRGRGGEPPGRRRVPLLRLRAVEDDDRRRARRRGRAPGRRLRRRRPGPAGLVARSPGRVRDEATDDWDDTGGRRPAPRLRGPVRARHRPPRRSRPRRGRGHDVRRLARRGAQHRHRAERAADRRARGHAVLDQPRRGRADRAAGVGGGAGRRTDRLRVRPGLRPVRGAGDDRRGRGPVAPARRAGGRRAAWRRRWPPRACRS